jgi:hypothetical protein
MDYSVKLFLNKPPLFLLSLLLLPMFSTGPVLAAPRNPRNYAAKILKNPQGSITGVKGTFTSGTSHLVNTATPGGSNSSAPFINKDLWLITSTASSQDVYGCWIEAMVTKTNFVTGFYQPQTGPNIGPNTGSNTGTLPTGSTLSGNSFNGYWIATQRAYNAVNALYTEYPYGTSNSPTAANGGSVEIARGAGSDWLVKVNGTTALTLSTLSCAKYVSTPTGIITTVIYTPTGGSVIQMGLEANDDSSQITFTQATKITDLQFKQGTGSYTVIPNTPLINQDLNNVNWTSTYSNGQLTINK